MSIHAVDKNMLVDNVIIEYRDRPDGSESKLNTYTDGMKVLFTIIKLFKGYRPFQFFGSMAFLLMIIAAGLFIPVFMTYLHTGLVPNFPTLIVSGFIALAALQAFFSGLILSTIVQKNRQDFEFKLQLITNKIDNEKDNLIYMKDQEKQIWYFVYINKNLERKMQVYNLKYSCIFYTILYYCQSVAFTQFS